MDWVPIVVPLGKTMSTQNYNIFLKIYIPLRIKFGLDSKSFMWINLDLKQ